MAIAEVPPRTVKRVPLLLSVLISLVLLASAAMVVWAISDAMAPMHEAFEAGLAAHPAYQKTWVPLEQLDNTLKVVHLVFTEFFLLKPVHYWFLEVWMIPCSILIFFQSIDFDRLSMRMVPLYVFFYQYVGIGICWPLVMIYYLYRRNAHSGRFPGGSTPARVIITGFSAIASIVLLASLPTLKRDGDIYFWTVNVFLILPCVLPLFTYLISSETAPRSAPETARGQRFENLVYACLAGISFLLYWRSLPAFFESYVDTAHLTTNLPKALLNAAFGIWSDLTSNPVQRFLMFDCLSSVIVIVSFVLMDAGLLATIFTILVCPLISPGAAVAIYLLRRESIIYGTATGTWSTKVNSPGASASRAH